ncbi:MAG: purN [Gammaproteobacteria bacterium]|jgi:phosphoribosylglycinamide formyltransferase-1|nr:purN [Gammaproteobacteria bacterium]
MLRLGILGSTRGTVMLALIKAIQEKRLAAEIAVVCSNRAEALILENAKSHGLMTHFIDAKNITKEAYDQKISDILKKYHVELVLLIGYMKILSAGFIQTWRERIINVHPSLLPAFAGGMDSNVHQAVLDAGMTESGCTVHQVTEEVDAGPILMQKKCVVLPDDNRDSLKARVQALEAEALIEVIYSMVQKRRIFI